MNTISANTEQENWFLQQLSSIYLNNDVQWFHDPVANEPASADKQKGGELLRGKCTSIRIDRTKDFPQYLGNVVLSSSDKNIEVLIAATLPVRPTKKQVEWMGKVNKAALLAPSSAITIAARVNKTPTPQELIAMWDFHHPTSPTAENEKARLASLILWPHISNYFYWESELQQTYEHNLQCLACPAFPSWFTRRKIHYILKDLLTLLKLRTSAVPNKIFPVDIDCELWLSVNKAQLMLRAADSYDMMFIFPKANTHRINGFVSKKSGTGGKRFVSERCSDMKAEKQYITLESFLKYLEERELPTEVLVCRDKKLIAYDKHIPNKNKELQFESIEKYIREFNKSYG